MPNLLDVIKQIIARKELETYDEATTQQGVILPVFQALGWDVFDTKEVIPQYGLGSDRVDYALCPAPKREVKVLCEVKRPSVDDLSLHEEQLVKYAFKVGADLAVLTNGIAWWLYLPVLNVAWEKRKFFTVDLKGQSPEDVAQRLAEFLSSENVKSGKAKSNAEELHRSHQKQQEIEETLPKAWTELVSTPDELLVDLLSDRVETLCGFRPDTRKVIDFLQQGELSTEVKALAPTPSNPRKAKGRIPRPGTIVAAVLQYLANKPQARADEVRQFLVTHGHPDTKFNASHLAWYRREVRIGNLLMPGPSWRQSLARPGKSSSAVKVTGKKPSRASFKGRELPVGTWKDLYLALCAQLHALHGTDFKKVLDMRGHRNAWFSRDPSQLRQADQIASTEYYADTWLSAQGILTRCHALLKLFGHDPSELKIQTR